MKVCRASTPCLLLHLVACGGASPPARPAPPGEGAAPAVAPRFADGLFREGARWTFRITRSYESFDGPSEEVPDEAPADQVPAGDAAALEAEAERATCWVAAVTVTPDVSTSEIECETPRSRDAEHLVGVWQRDARGLWQGTYETDPATPPAADAEPFLPFPPLARHEESDPWEGEPPDEDEGFREQQTYIVDIRADGADTWCRRDELIATHAERFELCLDPVGPRRWSMGWDGTSDAVDAVFERID